MLDSGHLRSRLDLLVDTQEVFRLFGSRFSPGPIRPCYQARRGLCQGLAATCIAAIDVQRPRHRENHSVHRERNSGDRRTVREPGSPFALILESAAKRGVASGHSASAPECDRTPISRPLRTPNKSVEWQRAGCRWCAAPLSGGCRSGTKSRSDWTRSPLG